MSDWQNGQETIFMFHKWKSSTSLKKLILTFDHRENKHKKPNFDGINRVVLHISYDTNVSMPNIITEFFRCVSNTNI